MMREVAGIERTGHPWNQSWCRAWVSPTRHSHCLKVTWGTKLLLEPCRPGDVSFGDFSHVRCLCLVGRESGLWFAEVVGILWTLCHVTNTRRNYVQVKSVASSRIFSLIQRFGEKPSIKARLMKFLSALVWQAMLWRDHAQQKLEEIHAGQTAKWQFQGHVKGKGHHHHASRWYGSWCRRNGSSKGLCSSRFTAFRELWGRNSSAPISQTQREGHQGLFDEPLVHQCQWFGRTMEIAASNRQSSYIRGPNASLCTRHLAMLHNGSPWKLSCSDVAIMATMQELVKLVLEGRGWKHIVVSSPLCSNVYKSDGLMSIHGVEANFIA